MEGESGCDIFQQLFCAKHSDRQFTYYGFIHNLCQTSRVSINVIFTLQIRDLKIRKLSNIRLLDMNIMTFHKRFCDKLVIICKNQENILITSLKCIILNVIYLGEKTICLRLMNRSRSSNLYLNLIQMKSSPEYLCLFILWVRLSSANILSIQHVQIIHLLFYQQNLVCTYRIPQWRCIHE